MNSTPTLLDLVETFSQTYHQATPPEPISSQDLETFERIYKTSNEEDKTKAIQRMLELPWHSTMENVYDSIFVAYSNWHEVLAFFFQDKKFKSTLYQVYRSQVSVCDDARAMMVMNFSYEKPNVMGITEQEHRDFLLHELHQLSTRSLSKILNALPWDEACYPFLERVISDAGDEQHPDSHFIRENVLTYFDAYFWADEWTGKTDDLTQPAQAWYLAAHRMMHPFGFYDQTLGGIASFLHQETQSPNVRLTTGCRKMYEDLMKQLPLERLERYLEQPIDQEFKHSLFDVLPPSLQERVCHHPDMQAHPKARMMADLHDLKETVEPIQQNQPHAKPRMI